MKFIQKTENPPPQFEEWKMGNREKIEDKIRLYETSLDTNKPEKSDIVWNELPSSSIASDDFSKADLRLILLQEQGFICAYCGSRIFNNVHIRLDHVDPKSLVIRRTFDYYNLVAACSGGAYIWHTIQAGETLNSIAEKYGTDPQRIKNLNPKLNFLQDENIEIRIGSDEKIAIQVVFIHCDNKKKDKPHPIKPIDADCQAKFEYTEDGIILGVCEDAKITIDILGLNDNTFLIEKRRNIYMDFKKVISILKSPRIPKEDKRSFLNKWKPNLSVNELEEMIFVKEFWWNTLPTKT